MIKIFCSLQSDLLPLPKKGMSNPAFMTVYFEGEQRELKSLYGKMKRLQERQKPLVENGFYNPTRWLGNLVVRLGYSWKKVYCRGTWDSLTLQENHLCFSTETAWNPPFDLLKLIQKVYPSFRFYFEAEGDWDEYVTNDAEGRYFTNRFVVDTEPDIEYFDTIEEASAHLAKFIGKPVAANWEALYQAAEDWNELHEDSDWPIDVKQISVIGNDELW